MLAGLAILTSPQRSVAIVVVVATVLGLAALRAVAGAAMAVTGLFSYLGAAIQEQVSGVLIQRGMHVVGGVRTYDFGPAILFWMAASVASLALATSLWNTKLRD